MFLLSYFIFFINFILFLCSFLFSFLTLFWIKVSLYFFSTVLETTNCNPSLLVAPYLWIVFKNIYMWTLSFYINKPLATFVFIIFYIKMDQNFWCKKVWYTFLHFPTFEFSEFVCLDGSKGAKVWIFIFNWIF